VDDNQFALITGTSSGLGLRMAEELLELGYNVIGISRRGSPIDHPFFIDILCDIKDESAVEEMFELVLNHTQNLSLIVLNAGILEMSPLVEMSSKEFLDHFETNVLGAFHILKHATSFFVEGDTHIISVSSTASIKGLANLSAFSASKSALNLLIKSLREEWVHLGLRFSSLLPGPIRTEVWDNYNLEPDQKRQLMSIDHFIYVFKMVVLSPKELKFDEIEFTQI
jgi:NAD(P)-dependent dehydrogenase (short-subunit alcohol dehydrogenase family)